MHLDTRPRTYRAVDGSTREYRQVLLRRSYRNAEGKPAKETLANLSSLPDSAVHVLRSALAGKTLVDVDEAFQIERSVAHGHVAAVQAMATRLKFGELLGPRCRERDLAYALILSRAIAPASKLSTIRWWADTSLGADLGIVDARTDDVYAAMDWLLAQQGAIEKKLAARHLRPGGMALFDLSSTWMEGKSCPLAKFGYSRDGKRGLPQIEFGLLGDAEGRPIAVRVFDGNVSDSRSFREAISTVRDQFGLTNLTLVGDPWNDHAGPDRRPQGPARHGLDHCPPGARDRRPGRRRRPLADVAVRHPELRSDHRPPLPRGTTGVLP